MVGEAAKLPLSRGGAVVIQRDMSTIKNIIGEAPTPRQLLFHEAGHALDRKSFFSEMKNLIKGVMDPANKGKLKAKIEQAQREITIQKEIKANSNALQHMPAESKKSFTDATIKPFKSYVGVRTVGPAVRTEPLPHAEMMKKLRRHGYNI